MKRALISVILFMAIAAIVAISSLAVAMQSAEAGKAWCYPC